MIYVQGKDGREAQTYKIYFNKIMEESMLEKAQEHRNEKSFKYRIKQCK